MAQRLSRSPWPHDVNADGAVDLVVGAGSGPHVKVAGDLPLVENKSFFANDASFIGGVFVG